MPETREDTGTGAGQSRLSEILEPFQCVINFRVEVSNEILAVVPGVPLEKGGYFDGRRVPCQLPVGKNFRGRHVAARGYHQEPVAGHFHGRQDITDAFRPGRVARSEYGYVCPQRDPQSLQRGVVHPAEYPIHIADLWRDQHGADERAPGFYLNF